MLTSLAIIFLLGLLMESVFNKLKLPSLMGMIFTGILLSPYVFNLLDQKILSILSDLRRLALITILTRAGLLLDIKDLKKVGRSGIPLSMGLDCGNLVLTVAVLAIIITALFEAIGIDSTYKKIL